MTALKDEVDWLDEDPAYNQAAVEGGFKSEDYLYFIRAIRMELLNYVHDLASNPTTTKTEFLFELSKLSREWEIKSL